MYAFVNLFSLVIMSAASMGENPLSPCPVGFIPPECIHECHDGHYGVNCMSLCSASCLNTSCRPQNGDCYRCQVGFFGPMCAEKCRQGSHGANCSLACPVNCLDRLCDPFSGYCLDCIVGYGGSKCEDVKRLQSFPTPAKQVSPAEKNDHTVLYISIIVVTVTLPVCTVSLWVCILKKKFKEIYYKRYLDRAASFSPIYLNPKDSLPFLESNYGGSKDALKTMMKQLYAKRGSSPLGYPGKRPRKHLPRPHDKSDPRKHAGAGGETLGAAQVFSPEENQDDLRQMLKRNNSILLSQAANYTVDLFFKTPNPDLRPAQESPGADDHPPETLGANRLTEGVAAWSLVPTGDSPVPGDHERKTSLAEAKDGSRLNDPASLAMGNVAASAGNHVSEQMPQVYQFGVLGNQQNVTEKGDREPGLPSPYSGIASRKVEETTSYEKGTNVCDADLLQLLARPQKQRKSGLSKLWKLFSRATILGSRKARQNNEPAVSSPVRQPVEAPFADHHPPPEKVDRPSNRNLTLRSAHRVFSCPVLVSRDIDKHRPTPLTQVTHSVPVIKQPPVYPRSGDVLRAGSQSNKTPRRGKFSRRCSEVSDCNVNIVSQSEAVTKTTVQRLVPWPNESAQAYSQEHKYAGALTPQDGICDGRPNCVTPLPVQEKNAPDTLYMSEDAGYANTPLSPSVTHWPVTSYFYTSRCIESASGTPVTRCSTPVICETIDMLNATVNTQVSEATQYKNSATISDDQQSTTFMSFRDSTKNSVQHRVPDMFSSSASREQKSANMHSFQGNRTAEDDRNVENHDTTLVNVDAFGSQTRLQKRSTQTRLTGAKHPAHVEKTGASMQRKNVRTRMSRMISREEISPVLYRSPCHSPGLVLNKTESYTKCTPAGLVQQLTDQHVRFMHVAPMSTSRNAVRFRESFTSKERVAAHRCRASELNEHHSTGNDTYLPNHPDSRSIPSGDAQKVPDRGSYYNSTTLQAGVMGSPDFSGILKEANRRGRDALHNETLKWSESKPPKGLVQRTDKVHRRKLDSPVDQRQFTPSPDRKSCYNPSPSNMPLNISRNNAPTVCCQESTSSAIDMEEILSNTTSNYIRMNDSAPGSPREGLALSFLPTSPKRPVVGLEGAYNGSVSNNSLGPANPRDSPSFQYLERKPNNLRDGRGHLRQASESMTRGDLSDNRVNVSEVTDPKETYAEAFSLHGCHDRRAQRSPSRECFAGVGGCETDYFLTNTHALVRVSPRSLKQGELHRNQNNDMAVHGAAKNRSPALLHHVDFEDLTHNAVNTCARLANYRHSAVLHNNPLSPRLAIMGKGSRATGLKHARKTRLSFPLYDINSGDDKENPMSPLCKKPSSELTSGQVLCKKKDLSPLVMINRVVISEPASSESSTSSETDSVIREDKATCVGHLKAEVLPGSVHSSLQPIKWPASALRKMLTDEEAYRTKDDSNLPSGVLQNRNDDDKGLAEPRQNIHFVLKSPSLRKSPRRLRNGCACRSESPYVAAQYPMPSILEAVAQTDDSRFDGNSRFALGDRSDDTPKPSIRETVEQVYKAMAGCRSCPLFSRTLSFPASLHSAPRQALLVDHAVNTAFDRGTAEAGCQSAAPIVNADKSCLANKKSIIRDLRSEERTEYRSIIEGDSEFFYDAMDYRDFESNTSKEQSDLTFTKSPTIEPADKAELNGQKQKSRRFLLVNLMNRCQRNRCHLSKLAPSALTSFAKPPSKLKQASLGGASQGARGTDSHKASVADARLVRPKKKFALILAPAAAKQARNASADSREKSGVNRADYNSSKKCLKGGGGTKLGSSGLTILACSWQAKKVVHDSDTERAGEGSEGSSTWTASGGNPKPAAQKRADRRHGIPPRSEVFFDVS